MKLRVLFGIYIVVLIGIMFLFSSLIRTIPQTSSAPIQPTITLYPSPKLFDESEKQTLYTLINSYREEKQLRQLTIDERLAKSAQEKIEDMITNNYFSHYDTKKRPPWHFFNESGYKYVYAGENLSEGFNSGSEIFEEWKKSPAHDTQLKTSVYRNMGIGYKCAYFRGVYDTCLIVLHLGATY